MFALGRRRSKDRPQKQLRSLMEPLEMRTLLSSAPSVIFHTDSIILHPSATTSTTIQGYTPSQIRHAYGFDQVTGTGQVQTIAIVDAYNDPNIKSDLSTFDQQFGLGAAPSFQVVSQTGSSTNLPTTDSGWSGEIALDVEWAHAIAPGANILLVEAKSATLNDLMTAVDYARNAAGVSVVSMSWGGSEFFNWNGSEFTGQTQYDPQFTTPSGHQGVTFVAAAGDSGASGGVQWPASSPNVVSVGGTSLTVSDSSGTYFSESSWSGTSGGFSQVEIQPTYQNAVQNTGVRTTPDVSYDGDPNTGFAVYDSLPDQGYSGWQEVGGTSAGAPQWAALIAIANQLRAAAGKGTLDGVSQTLPMLYSLYGAPGTTAYANYSSNFNDVIDPTGYGGGRWHWRWGYGVGNPATAGYDTATGLGTPVASKLIQSLVSGGSSSGGSNNGSGSNSGSGSGSGSTTTTPLPAGQLDGVIVSSPPASVMAGQPGRLRLKITNTVASKFSGPVSIDLYASTDGTVGSGDVPFATINVPSLKLAGGASKTLTLKFNYPTASSDGLYYIVASIKETGTNTAPAQAFTPSLVAISPAKVDLAVSFDNLQGVKVNPGKDSGASITIQNQGNVTATGSVVLNLYASTGSTLSSSAQLLLTLPARKINLKPGKSITLHVHFQAPAGRSGGTYNLIASISSSTQLPDSNSSNDVAVTATV